MHRHRQAAPLIRRPRCSPQAHWGPEQQAHWGPEQRISRVGARDITHRSGHGSYDTALRAVRHDVAGETLHIVFTFTQARANAPKEELENPKGKDQAKIKKIPSGRWHRPMTTE